MAEKKSGRAPMRGAWIEMRWQATAPPRPASRPTRARGLKSKLALGIEEENGRGCRMSQIRLMHSPSFLS